MDRKDFLLKLTAGVIALGAFAKKGYSQSATNLGDPKSEKSDEGVKDYLHRMRFFDEHYATDIYVENSQIPVLSSCVKKLKSIERIVGFSNFSVMSFPKAISIAKYYSRVERFSKEELDFMDNIFYTDAAVYGFFGEKPITDKEIEIKTSDLKKIAGTSHLLYRGAAVETYEKVKVLGNGVVLTSGIRGIVKQMFLFLNKADQNRGNLSLASRQLAPPGYSFHGIGDLDVGKDGLGFDNFTEKFIETDTYKQLSGLGYLKLRYPEDNMLGVRFEPWHVKVVELSVS